MRRALIAVLALLALAPAAGASRYRVGLGEQSPSMFTAPAFQPLGIERVRYIVPWDWRRDAGSVALYLTTARAHHVKVMVHFTASPGCWNERRYSRSARCRAPSAARYAASVRAFRRRFPWIDVFGAWNEANHAAQPTYRRPALAARYYDTLRGVCPRCRIVAADLLDSRNVISYVRAFRRAVHGHPRLWGLHDYSDVNRARSIQTRAYLREVPGQVWLTETGGIVRFGSRFPYSPRRAAARTRYLFALADRLSRSIHGYRSRVTRVYPYRWLGGPSGALFDSGFVDARGKPRPAYAVLRAKLRTRSK
jgi:hypothetical protein